jgi:putative intracellular protease/amidase
MALICAGPTLLKASDIARGYKITAYPCFAASLSQHYTFLHCEAVVIDRNLITRY